MKTKRQHIKSLREVQRSIVSILLRVDKEGHIPVWQLRIWGSKVKAAANFLKKIATNKEGYEKALREIRRTYIGSPSQTHFNSKEQADKMFHIAQDALKHPKSKRR